MPSELRNFRAEANDEFWCVLADSDQEREIVIASFLDERTARGMAAWSEMLIVLELIRASLDGQNNAVAAAIRAWADNAISKASPLTATKNQEGER